MAVKLRLIRVGKTKQPQYRIVAADCRSPRDGRFIEIIGQYNPRQEPSVVNLDDDKAARSTCRKAPSRPSGSHKLLEIAGATGPRSRAAGAVVSDVETTATTSVPAPTATAVLDHVVRALVDEPESVRIDTEQRGRRMILEVHVAPGDLGRRHRPPGRTAQSIRTVVRAAASRDGVAVDVDFVD